MGFGGEEGDEDVAGHLGGDVPAVVTHQQETAGPLEADGGGTGFHGVLHQVEHHLGEHLCVGLHHRAFRYVCFPCQCGAGGLDLAHKGMEVHGCADGLLLLGELAVVLHEGEEVLRHVVDGEDALLVVRGRSGGIFEQQLADAKAAAKKLHEETMAHAEDLYNKTKVKTDNMLQATMVECNKLRDEAKAYAEELRRTAQVETDKLRLANEEMCKKRSNIATVDANKLLDDARNEAGKMMLEANTKYRKIVGDAEEKSRKIIFDAENRVSIAEQSYENQVKKCMLYCKNMQHLLETQLELVKNFTKQADE